MHKRIQKVGHIKGTPKNGNYDVPVYRVVYIDSDKNLSFVKKREDLAKRATLELGVTCFG